MFMMLALNAQTTNYPGAADARLILFILADVHDSMLARVLRLRIGSIEGFRGHALQT